MKKIMTRMFIYIDNDDWYTTETVVHQQPSAGHRKVVAVCSL